MSLFQDVGIWLGVLNLLVAFLGVAFVMLAFFEWRNLNALRKDFENFKQDLVARQHRLQKALQRVIASYGLQDPERRIALLRSAIAIDPTVFNAYNALGYACLDKGDTLGAIDAFRQAIQQHSEDKEGYFDLARAFLRLEPPRRDLAESYLRQVLQIDLTARQDLEQDTVLRQVIKC